MGGGGGNPHCPATSTLRERPQRHTRGVTRRRDDGFCAWREAPAGNCAGRCREGLREVGTVNVVGALARRCGVDVLSVSAVRLKSEARGNSRAVSDGVLLASPSANSLRRGSMAALPWTGCVLAAVGFSCIVGTTPDRAVPSTLTSRLGNPPSDPRRRECTEPTSSESVMGPTPGEYGTMGDINLASLSVWERM